MTEADRRMLTEEILGERWHETYLANNIYTCSCGNTWHAMFSSQKYHCNNRSFIKGQDLYDLYRKLLEMGEWGRFENWAYVQFDGDPTKKTSRDMCNPAAFTAWLYHVDRIPLIAEWWREHNKKGA